MILLTFSMLLSISSISRLWLVHFTILFYFLYSVHFAMLFMVLSSGFSLPTEVDSPTLLIIFIMVAYSFSFDISSLGRSTPIMKVTISFFIYEFTFLCHWVSSLLHTKKTNVRLSYLCLLHVKETNMFKVSLLYEKETRRLRDCLGTQKRDLCLRLLHVKETYMFKVSLLHRGDSQTKRLSCYTQKRLGLKIIFFSKFFVLDWEFFLDFASSLDLLSKRYSLSYVISSSLSLAIQFLVFIHHEFARRC